MSQTLRKIIALTDLHVTRAGEDIIGLDTAARLSQTLAHAIAHHPDATAIILMGDLTHHGTAEEYRRLQALLADVP